MIPRLDDPSTYREVLDDLARKWSARGRLDRLEVDGVTLAELSTSTRPLGNLLAQTVASGQYRYSPLVAVDARIDGKRRTLYRPNLLDRVVLTVIARYLTALSEPFLLPVLHSYRKGHSPWKAIAALREFLQDHRCRVPLKERGLYVLRRDIRKYGENIGIGQSSPLWDQIGRVLRSDPDAQRRAIGERLVVEAIRQPVLASDGSAAPLKRGVPTGSPVQPPSANLYLASVDEYCSSVVGGFYARFGDDLLFCHPDADVAAAMSREIERRFAALGLSSNQQKQHDFEFNGAGRRCCDTAGFRPCNQIEYLGASIDFCGNTGLKREKLRAFEGELRVRLHRVADASAALDRDSRLQLIGEAVRVALDPTDPMSLSQAESLRNMVTQRSQLRDLDNRIALTVAELVAGRRGRRAFRSVAYAELRRGGLPSLVALRDRLPEVKRRDP